MPKTDRQDANREKTVSAIRKLHQLLAMAADPKFCGTVSVEISVKDGRYGRPKITFVEYDRDTQD